MTNLNAIIQPERPTITAIIGAMRKKDYFVDNSFQRRLVWTERQKIRLIETVLMNYPMPEIYLWQQPADPETGAKKFSIVDGQQRLTSLLQFISNEYVLKKSALDSENRSADYAGKFWKDLSPEHKTAIWDYIINIRQIPSSVSKETIRAVFRRVNETDRSLNPQELRHAQFDGEFLKAAETVADNPFWSKWKVFPLNQLRRMGDVEFCSGLLNYLRSGVTEESAATMNATYDLFNDEYSEREKDLAKAKAILARMNTLFEQDVAIQQLFSSVVHLYTLFVVLDRLPKSDKNLNSSLHKFVLEYKKDVSKSAIVEIYRKAASYRTRSKSSRVERVNALEDWLKAKAD